MDVANYIFLLESGVLDLFFSFAIIILIMFMVLLILRDKDKTKIDKLNKEIIKAKEKKQILSLQIYELDKEFKILKKELKYLQKTRK